MLFLTTSLTTQSLGLTPSCSVWKTTLHCLCATASSHTFSISLTPSPALTRPHTTDQQFCFTASLSTSPFSSGWLHVFTSCTTKSHWLPSSACLTHLSKLCWHTPSSITLATQAVWPAVNAICRRLVLTADFTPISTSCCATSHCCCWAACSHSCCRLCELTPLSTLPITTFHSPWSSACWRLASAISPHPHPHSLSQSCLHCSQLQTHSQGKITWVIT